LDETFAVVLTNGNTVADRCSTVLLYDRGVRWSVFHQLTEFDEDDFDDEEHAETYADYMPAKRM